MMIEQLEQVVRLAQRDVVGTSRATIGRGQSGSDCSIDCVGDVAEVPALTAVAVDGWRLALAQGIDERRDHRRVRGVRPLTRAVRVEVPEATWSRDQTVPCRRGIYARPRASRRHRGSTAPGAFFGGRYQLGASGTHCSRCNDHSAQVGVAGGREDSECRMHIGSSVASGLSTDRDRPVCTEVEDDATAGQALPDRVLAGTLATISCAAEFT